jgi:hypothetical protein
MGETITISFLCPSIKKKNPILQAGEGFYRNDSGEPIDVHLPVKEQV